MDSFLHVGSHAFQFSAKWITAEEISPVNVALLAYSDVELPRGTEPRLLHICAESFYRLYINGKFAGRGPVRGTAGINFFDTYDIAGFLHHGKNHVAIMVQSMVRHGNFNTFPAGCGLILEIPGILESNENWKVIQAPGWENCDRFFSFQHGFKEMRDLRKENASWLAGFGTENWTNAKPLDNVNLRRKKMAPRNIPSLKETRLFPVGVQTAEVGLSVPQGDEDIADVLNREEWRCGKEKVVDQEALTGKNGGCCKIMQGDRGGGGNIGFRA